jgi:hypothetical protein
MTWALQARTLRTAWEEWEVWAVSPEACISIWEVDRAVKSTLTTSSKCSFQGWAAVMIWEVASLVALVLGACPVKANNDNSKEAIPSIFDPF